MSAKLSRHIRGYRSFGCAAADLGPQSDGPDIRTLPLSMRKASLARLRARRVDGIFLSDFEQGEIGPDLFRHACLLGLERLVCKHCESNYRGGRSDHWITELAMSLIGAHPSRCYPTRRCS